MPARLVRALLDIKELGLVEGKALRVGLYGPIRVLMRWSRVRAQILVKTHLKGGLYTA